MNHYNRHLGDYLKKTIGLSMRQDGAYNRMIDLYYIQEAPLTLNLSDLYSDLRCKSQGDRAAVDFVLTKHFVKLDDGYHNTRCDEELATYADSMVDSEAKKEHEKERQKRARERRRALFGQLRELGITPPWDSTTADLEAALSRVTNAERTPPVTRDESDPSRVTAPRRTPADTANQSPLPSNHRTSNTKSKSGSANLNGHARATRLSADWRLPDEWKNWAIEAHNLDPQRVTRISLAFKDFWIAKAGPNAAKLNWEATWRNWVRKEVGDA